MIAAGSSAARSGSSRSMMASLAPSGIASRQLRRMASASGVVILLEHALQQIEIGFHRDAVEQISWHEFDALGDVEEWQERLRHLDHVRPVERHVGKLRLGLQDGDGPDTGKVERSRRWSPAGQRSPWPDKSRTARLARRVSRRQSKTLMPKTCSKAGLPVSRLDDEIGPGQPVLPDDDLDFLGEAGGRARAQRLAARRQRERAVSQLLANADAAQPAQEAGEGAAVDSSSVSASCGARRGARREPVGKPEPDRGIDQRRLVIGLDLLAEPVLERRLICHRESRWC